jgi:hypothetical protein
MSSYWTPYLLLWLMTMSDQNALPDIPYSYEHLRAQAQLHAWDPVNHIRDPHTRVQALQPVAACISALLEAPTQNSRIAILRQSLAIARDKVANAGEPILNQRPQGYWVGASQIQAYQYVADVFGISWEIFGPSAPSTQPSDYPPKAEHPYFERSPEAVAEAMQLAIAAAKRHIRRIGVSLDAETIRELGAKLIGLAGEYKRENDVRGFFFDSPAYRSTDGDARIFADYVFSIMYKRLDIDSADLPKLQPNPLITGPDKTGGAVR